jgi:hypothetical protein
MHRALDKCKHVHTEFVLVDRFSDIFVIDASSAESIAADLQNIALAKGVGDSDDDALQWLSRLIEEWLLFFDNADDTTFNLRDFFPYCSHGNIIVTSRNNETRIHAPDPRSDSKVSRLTPDDAIDLLFKIARVTVDQSGKTRMLAANIVEARCPVFPDVIRLMILFIRNLVTTHLP